MKKIATIIFIMLGIISASLILVQCSTFQADNWETEISEVGLTSSPRPVDLNNDGILDLVIGAGGSEFEHTNQGIIALNGKNGEILWSVEARNQVVGSAVFMDITSDDIPDVFIGGRSAVLMAIDGKNGNKIWEYLPDSPTMDMVNDTTYLNFYTPQLIHDIDEDGFKDLLISFGGFFRARAGDNNRPSGSLMILSSKTGEILNELLVPDRKETYMSPVIYDFFGNGKPDIIIGTGGESLDGNLFRIKFDDLLNNQLSEATILSTGQGKGFIAPPVLADITNDGIKDIIINAVNGRMMSFDGKTNELLWEFSLGEDFEVYTMPAPGNFTGDKTPDFYGSFGKGAWPNSEFIAHFIVDGKDGKLVFSDTIGFFQYASPVIYDLTKNGKDEVIMVNNDVRKVSESMEMKLYSNDVRVLDVETGVFKILFGPYQGSNLGSTPLISDLDNDGYLDFIHCYMKDPSNFYSFKESRIERTELKVKLEDKILWGTYMGQNHDGVYSP